ncbi:hypothetical protein BH23CHL1_BH23CHL1_16470 [soil metagenome]
MVLNALNRMIVEAQISKEDLFRKDEGQGMVEYGLIIALVAVVVIGALTALGTGISGIFDTIAGSFGGA